MIIPRIVVRLGARRIRTNGRVGISKSVEIDLTNPQAKAEIHEDTNFCLDKIKQYYKLYKRNRNATWKKAE